MNYNKVNGWYYINSNDKSPSWTGVEFLYDFLIHNTNYGPCGEETNNLGLKIGDVVQLSFSGVKFEHSLIVVNISNIADLSKIYIASHTLDSYNKPISSYKFKKIRFVHINNVKTIS